MKLSCRLFIYH